MTVRRGDASAVRRISLTLPDTEELRHMGVPSFRVSGKIFAQLTEDEMAALFKVSAARQAALRETYPADVWLPSHWGKFGWTYIRLECLAITALEALVEESWSSVAPKALVARRNPGPRPG